VDKIASLIDVPAYIDETGKKYGQLHVIRYVSSAQEGRRRNAMFECVCECGEIIVVRGQRLRNGGITMCPVCYSVKKGSK
jgi:hypothetical protein